MSLLSLLGQTATVTPRSADIEDEYGDITFALGPPVDYPCRLEDTDSVEVTGGEDRVTTSARAFLPAAAEVSHLDTVSIDGRTFEVIGSPSMEVSPAGPHHQVVALREVLGG